jgi:tRNA threonylcarbamoyladenosine biosynthesis protein TsaB
MKNLKLLALDTATEACSAALYIDGEIIQRYQLAPREHTSLILQMLDDCLAEGRLSLSDLDALAFGRGPGSFMGLRVAAGVVQGVSLAHDLPIVPVSTLASIAHLQMQQGAVRVLAAIDARMSEVYWGAYLNKAGIPVLQGKEMVVPPAQVPVPDTEGWSGVGTGWGSYADVLKQRLGACVSSSYAEVFPSAASIVQLAVAKLASGETGVDASHAIPVYLRDQVAKKTAER